MNFLLLCNKLPQTQQLETTDIHNHPASGMWEQPGWVLLFSLCPRVGHSHGCWVEASVLTTWPPHRPLHHVGAHFLLGAGGREGKGGWSGWKVWWPGA